MISLMRITGTVTWRGWSWSAAASTRPAQKAWRARKVPIDAEAMRAGLDAFLALAEARDKIRCVYTITDIEIPPLDALMVEFGYFGRLFQLLGKLDRVALIVTIWRTPPTVMTRGVT